jgi:hypothetical protein
MTIRIFISYSHKDDTHRLRLATHMAPLLREKDVEAWFDGHIEPGQAITPAIRKALRQTDIFVALGSSDYLQSDYCYRKEYQLTLRRAKQGLPKVVVALVGICDWPNTEMAQSKMLPNDAKSVEEHGLRNRAYLEIVQGIRRIVRALRQEKGKAQAEIDRLAVKKAKADAAKRIERQKVRDEKPGKMSAASKNKVTPKAASRSSTPKPAAVKTASKLGARKPRKVTAPTSKGSSRNP